jgi:general secretion pathway protein D
MLTNKRLTRLVVYLAPAGCVAVLLAWSLLARYPSAAAQQPTPTPTDAVLKVYRCPPTSAQAIAARLREEFRGVAGVRIGADERLGQILVQALPEIQAQVARRLATPPPNLRPQSSQAVAPMGAAYPPSALREPRLQSVQLRYVTARQIEAALVDTLGRRLSPVLGVPPAAKEYRLALSGGGSIRIGISYQTNQATVQGIGAAVDSCVRLIHTLDSPQQPADRSVRLVSLQTSSPASVQQVAAAIHQGAPSRPRGQMASAQVEQPEEEEPSEPPEGPFPAPPGPERAAPPPAGGQQGQVPLPEAGLIGPVQIEMLPGLDVLVIQGHQRDVERVMEIIQQVEKLSAETEPVIIVQQLQHTNCEALAALITPLYAEVYEPRQGSVSITALVKPNALLLVGRRENVQTVQNLVKRLDRPVAPEAEFQVFGLRHASATTAQTALRDFFGEEPTGLGTRVVVVADYRSNSLIVRAGPRDMAEVARLIERIDTPTVPAVNELRVFELFNSTADTVAQILEDAIRGQAAPAAVPGAAAQQAEQKSTALQFLTIDTKGQRRLRSGILTDVRITPNASANTLVVSGPAESMELIEAVIRQLDRPPVAEAQIKVFHIVNGDADALTTMLESLFAPAAAGEPAPRTAAGEGESSLVQLRFVADVRTNSIIASGTASDLLVVDAILTRLDESEVRKRQTQVYRLRNAPALDVATAINTYLQNERAVMQINIEMMSPYEQVQREVVVVPEQVSNTLIVSATPRYFKEIEELVKQLDERPPMVMIQVLIAEVALNDTDEFGVELGIQDSVLFDRSKLENLQTITSTTTTQTPGGATTSTQTQEIVSADNTPGFAFNNVPLGNSGADKAFQSARLLGTQGLSTFALNRVNSELGYGGMVLSASSDVLSILIRALKEERRLDVLSRPQIMTMDNQPAQIMVGQRVPLVRSVTISEVGQTFNTQPPEEVGLIVGVTPRISPDNVVVMVIEAVKAEVGPEAEGIPVSISATGEVVRTPRINRTSASTTVLAADGQTIVLGGLITKSKAVISRKVPLLAEIPLLGAMFRYDGQVEKKTELLIIMTPHVVRTPADAEMIKQVEAARMSWCLCDVLELMDDAGLRGRTEEWPDSETHVVYPDLQPGAETIPVPEAAPGQGPIVPPPAGGPFIPESTPGPNGVPPTPGAPQEAPAAPPPQASSGISPAAARSGPNAPRWNPSSARQVSYAANVYPAGGPPANYQWAGATAAQPYAGPGSAVQLGYATPSEQTQWPPGEPARQYPSPAAQPAQYNQPYQSLTAQPRTPQMSPYR